MAAPGHGRGGRGHGAGADAGGVVCVATGTGAWAAGGLALLLAAGAGAGSGVAVIGVVAPGAAPVGGVTRSTWPTSITFGLSRLFQRAMSRHGWLTSVAMRMMVSPGRTV